MPEIPPNKHGVLQIMMLRLDAYLLPALWMDACMVAVFRNEKHIGYGAFSQGFSICFRCASSRDHVLTKRPGRPIISFCTYMHSGSDLYMIYTCIVYAVMTLFVLLFCPASLNHQPCSFCTITKQTLYYFKLHKVQLHAEHCFWWPV